MRRAYQIVCHIIAVCVVVQAAVIAWSTFAILNASDEGGTVSVESGVTGFIVHSAVGQLVIPLLVLTVLVIALIARIGISWAVWLLVAVLVQLFLGYTSFDVPGLGLLHGINAFVILGLAETGARMVGTQPSGAKSVRTPAAERTALDDSA
ncbi:hypothetical protein [Cryobacterium sp. W22_MBD10_FK3]|uniref:hypothetical protein n=1 Tax=Cryobacterium sp. W22_MBD10_FK3 TaxID=3240273 RepID=UPI003F90C15D